MWLYMTVRLDKDSIQGDPESLPRKSAPGPQAIAVPVPYGVWTPGCQFDLERVQDAQNELPEGPYKLNAAGIVWLP